MFYKLIFIFINKNDTKMRFFKCNYVQKLIQIIMKTFFIYYIHVLYFQFNFVGKLLGPKGNSLKRLQEDTITKMAILGRGSMRDRNKVIALLSLRLQNQLLFIGYWFEQTINIIIQNLYVPTSHIYTYDISQYHTHTYVIIPTLCQTMKVQILLADIYNMRKIGCVKHIHRFK